MKMNLMPETHPHPPPPLLPPPQSWPQVPSFSLSFSPTSVTSQNSQLGSAGVLGEGLVVWLFLGDGGGVGIMNEWIKELKTEVKVLINR